MVIKALREYFHPLSGRLVYWNLILLVLVKLILPQSAFQLASFLDSLPVFDSREIIKLTNDMRALNSMSPLQANSKLDLAANEKLNDMAVKEYFAHVSPAGTTPWFWMNKAGYSYTDAGENLAIGFLTANETVKAWMDSPSHKANVLNPKYKEIGVAAKGVKIGDRDGILVVQMFGASSRTVLSNNRDISENSVGDIRTNTAGETITVVQAAESVSEPEIQTSAPVAVNYTDENNFKDIRAINFGFMAYASVIAALSLATFILVERSRMTALKMSLNLVIFLLAVAIPAVGTKLEGLIF